MPRMPIQAFSNGTALMLTTAPQAVYPLLAPQSEVPVQVVEHGTLVQLLVYQDETSDIVLSQPVLTTFDGAIPGWLDIDSLSAAGADLILALPGGSETVVLATPGMYGGSSSSSSSSSSVDGGSPSTNTISTSGQLDGGTP